MSSVQVDQVPGERDNFYDVKQILCAHTQLLRNVEHWAHQQQEMTALLLGDLESGKSSAAASLLGGTDVIATRVGANVTPSGPSDVAATMPATNEVSSGAASSTDNLEAGTDATAVSKFGTRAFSAPLSEHASFEAEDVTDGMKILENLHIKHEMSTLTNVVHQLKESGFLGSYCPTFSYMYYACKGKYALAQELGAEAPDRSGRVHSFVSSKTFDYLCTLVISINAVFIGWASDDARANLHDQTNQTRDLVDTGFCIFYIIELILKTSCQKWYFFFGTDWRWNYFDAFLVASAIHDQLSAYISPGEPGSNASFLRVLRLSKMLKLLRMVRLMRMFRELRLIMNSIMGSVKSLLWSFLLMSAVLFVFGVCFMQASTEYLRKEGDNVPDDIRQDFDEFWGSVTSAMLSMYMASTGGEDWKRIARPLKECGAIYYIGFLLYIGFYTCVITNTLTSLFVETTITNAANDQEAAISEELAHKDIYVKMLKDWFGTIDSDCSGSITYGEFVVALEDPSMVSFALEMGIDLPDIKQFFSVLSSNGQRGVDLDTFVVGCIKLKGAAKSMDLMDLVFAHRHATRDNKIQFESLHDRLLTMEDMLVKHFVAAPSRVFRQQQLVFPQVCHDRGTGEQVQGNTEEG